jgi:hypothetical protein
VAGSTGIAFLSFSSGLLEYWLARLHVCRYRTGPSIICWQQKLVANAVSRCRRAFTGPHSRFPEGCEL